MRENYSFRKQKNNIFRENKAAMRRTATATAGKGRQATRHVSSSSSSSSSSPPLTAQNVSRPTGLVVLLLAGQASLPSEQTSDTLPISSSSSEDDDDDNDDDDDHDGTNDVGILRQPLSFAGTPRGHAFDDRHIINGFRQARHEKTTKAYDAAMKRF